MKKLEELSSYTVHDSICMIDEIIYTIKDRYSHISNDTSLIHYLQPILLDLEKLRSSLIRRIETPI